MRERKLFCIGWLPILAISLALLTLTLMFKWRHIEQHVKSSAEQALASEEFSWASLETYNQGRNVVITGAAPNNEAIKKAEKLATNAYGVREATHNGEPLAAKPTPAPAKPTPDPAPVLQNVDLEMLVNGNKIELRGNVANQADADRLLLAARNEFGADNVVNYLTIDNTFKTIADIGFVGALGAAKESSNPIKARLQHKTLSLTGTVADVETRTTIGNAAKRLFNGTVDNGLTVPAPIKQDVCADLLAKLLATGKINFQTGNATIATDSYDLLDQIIAIAKRCPNANFNVEGHTDSTGNHNSNLRLSERRATSVINYLTEKGLNPQRFSAIGLGPNKPIASNNTAQGRAENRRIEFKLRN